MIEVVRLIAAEPFEPGFLVECDGTGIGCLCTQLAGRQEFIEYVERVHAALSGYRCTILKLVVRGNDGAARIEFSGKHTGDFLGYAPSWQRVSWDGAAFFESEDDQISSIWVLGDLDTLRKRLEHQRADRSWPD